jgi:hypothetical protein
MINGGRVLHSVLRPVHVDPRYASRRKSRWRGDRARITVGQTRATGKNQHWGGNERTEKRSSPLTTARKRSVMRKKRKEIKVSVPARTRRVQIRFGCPHVDIVKLQKSIGGIRFQISSANALQKERSGSSERGSSSARRSAGETVGRHVERNKRREAELTA